VGEVPLAELSYADSVAGRTTVRPTAKEPTAQAEPVSQDEFTDPVHEDNDRTGWQVSSSRKRWGRGRGQRGRGRGRGRG
jgi:hypothetical protein